jgi:copper oxidase (laccase) domain-containing protein
VGAEVRAAFVSVNPWAETAFQAMPTSGKYLADLPALARLRLRSQGVAVLQGNDSTPSWCTHHSADVFFSHRRDGLSGRFAAGIALC